MFSFTTMALSSFSSSLSRRSRFLCKCKEYLNPKRTTYKAVTRPDASKLKNPVMPDEMSVPAKICQLIKTSGPVTVADFMRHALVGSRAGYYMSRDMFGEGGDFVTSPELNQIFSEVLAIWMVAEWQKLGMPRPFQLVELGPGKGTLMAHMLKVFHKVGIDPNEHTMHLVEVSPVLQKYQADKLCITHKESQGTPHYHQGESVRNSKIFWYKDFNDIPKGFKLIVAHEFFDALPIHKLKKTESGWREILIDLDSPNVELTDPKFRYVLSQNETVTTKLYAHLTKDVQIDHVEICPQALVLGKQITSQVDENGGIALYIDYGEEKFMGDTFRAFKNHKQTDPLENVGDADLTADVNFKLLKDVSNAAKVFGPVTQRDFLLSSQAEVRLKVLLETASEGERKILTGSYNTLIDPDKMGNRFKFMAVFPSITEEHYAEYPVWGFS